MWKAQLFVPGRGLVGARGWHARPGDLLVAISSSGRSKNILNGVRVARERDCTVYTLSGFTADNPLRSTGHLNFYLDNEEYGFVEVGPLRCCTACSTSRWAGSLPTRHAPPDFFI